MRVVLFCVLLWSFIAATATRHPRGLLQDSPLIEAYMEGSSADNLAANDDIVRYETRFNHGHVTSWPQARNIC